MPTVYSTLTNDSAYVHYTKVAGNDLPTVKKKVTIKGGAGRGETGLLTPLGVATIITGDDLAFLEENDQFKKHKARGFLTVVSRDAPDNANKVAVNMEQEDGSRPLTPIKLAKLSEAGVKAAPEANLEIVKDIKAKKGK